MPCHSRFASIALLAGVVLSASGADAPRSRESFDTDWRFARFGSMPDGSARPEPGSVNWAIPLMASSEETAKGNTAAMAMDGNPATRWCADGGNPNQWLQLDLGSEQKLGSISIHWEKALAYQFVIEGQNGEQTWQILVDRSKNSDPASPAVIPLNQSVRQLRIRTTGLPAGQWNWASISEIDLTDAQGKAITNHPLKAGEKPSEFAFDDHAWRALDVPHDWGIEGPFREDLDNGTGKLPWKGIGWYRKHFTIPAGDQGRRLFVDFDGAMARAEVWLNGNYLGTWPFGYNSFRMELTKHLNYGGDNVLAVRLDAQQWGSRWYPGAGIYRHVWLVKTAPVHVGHWGTYVTTPEVSTAAGTMDVAVTIDNQGASEAKPTITAAVLELDAAGIPGRTVAQAPEVDCAIAADGNTTVHLTTTVAAPKLWDLSATNRYLTRVTVSIGKSPVDVYDTPFGFRTMECTPRDGFKLNGKRVEIKGTCNHHDLGALGTAINLRALERQLEILKDMGCNALRTSHNPPAPELLDLADRMGFLVMDEAFDCWIAGKGGPDYSSLYQDWHVKDLQAMVHRDRNHPSIFMWSAGNEVHEQNGPDPAKHMRDIIHAEDPTRPVTAGCNNWKACFNGFAMAVDVMGLNYHEGTYDKFFKTPGLENKAIIGSETGSTISSRGEYFFPVKYGPDAEVNFQVSSYDINAPTWATLPDKQFYAMDRNRAVLGEFVWTGFDYLGEPTPYNNDSSTLLNFKDPAEREAMRKQLEELGRIRVPSRSSYFGIIDLAGFPKDRFYIYQARWRPELPMVHILPHWNWPERVGQVTPVHIYTSGDEVELFLNGTSLGRKKKGTYDYRLRWDDVVYQPGEVKAVAYKNGQAWATSTMTTTTAPAKVLAKADRASIRADGQDLSYVTVRIADEGDLTVPRTHNLVTFSLTGPGTIAGVDNGDATSFEPFQASQRKAFNGLCLVIVRGKAGQSGTITLTAKSEGLRDTSVDIQSKL